MALSDSSNQNQNKQYATSYWSRFSIKQRDGKLRLTPSYSQGLMTLTVGEQGDNYKYNNIATITLSPTKAKIFAECLRLYQQDGKTRGVDTGIKEVRPIIAITTIDGNAVLVIGKITPAGLFESRVDFVLNSQYHYGLEWENLDDMESVSKKYYDSTEFEQLISLCEEFAISAFGATAASTCEMMRWDYSIPRSLDAIAAKLGVDTKSGPSNNTTRTGNSFFNRDENQNATPRGNRTSLDDLEEELMG
jgi:hypothetical protein